MSYDFKEGQSAVEYGESLLASREKSRKKASKRGRQIKRVNQALAAFKLGDLFLNRRAQNRVEDMTNQFTVDKANALTRIQQATNFRSDVLSKYTGVVDWDDPESWKKGGAVHRAIAEQHAAKFRAGRGTGTQQGLSASLDPASFEEQMREAVIADGSLEALRNKYNKHKGYLGQDTKAVEAQYKALIKNATKQIMNPQNTSTLRKLLGKVGLAKDLNADLTDLELGTGRTIKLDENTIQQYRTDFGRNTAAKVELDKEVSVAQENTGKSRNQILEDILKVDNIKIKTQSLKDVSPKGDATVDLLLFGDKPRNQASHLQGYLNNLEFLVPINEEKDGPAISIGKAFNNFSSSERVNFLAGVKENVKNNILTQQEIIKNLPGDPIAGITAEATVTQDILNEAINQTISQRVIFAKDATGKAIVGEERRFRRDIAADHYVLPELEYRALELKKLKAAGETPPPPPTITGDEDEDPTTPPSTTPPFNKALSGFRIAIKLDEWKDTGGNIIPKDVDSMFDQLQSDYGDDPTQREALRSIYNEYKEDAIKTPFTSTITTPTTIDKDKKLPTTVEELTAIGRGSRPTGLGEAIKGIVWAGGKSIIKQDKTRLQRYAETGKTQMHLKPTLEKYGLPTDASPEVVADMLLKTSESIGKHITELAIQKVTDVLPDSDNAKQFLTEIAEVESKFGTHRNTFKKKDSSGIFQIDRIAFDEVQRRLQPDSDVGENIRNYNEKLKEELGIDLTTASFSDLNTPLYGAAFARAYILTIPASIPTTLKARATYWKKYYNTSAGAGTVDSYIKRVTAITSLLNKSLG
jgi:hypothetical protein